MKIQVLLTQCTVIKVQNCGGGGGVGGRERALWGFYRHFAVEQETVKSEIFSHSHSACLSLLRTSSKFRVYTKTPLT